MKLSDLTKHRAIKLLELWRDGLNVRGVRQRASMVPGRSTLSGIASKMGLVLERLWKWVVNPILVALNLNNRVSKLPFEPGDLY